MAKQIKFWNLIKNENDKSAELILYGNIGSDEYWDDISDKAFKQDIENIGDVDNIILHINSPGGSVFSAVAIANTLKNHKATVTANIDGLAASAATIITSACDKVRMPKNALFMIHNPWTLAYGEKKDLEKTIDMLDKIKDSIIETYLSKTNIDRETLSELMDNETWLNSEEAKEYGFIDEITDETVEKDVISNKLVLNGVSVDLSKFKNFKGGEEMSKNNIKNKEEEDKMPQENQTVKNEELMLEDVKNKYPEIYDQIFDLGVKNERERLKEIDEMGENKYLDLVFQAKYTEPTNKEKLALNIYDFQKKEKQEKVNSIYDESNQNNVGTLGNNGTSSNNKNNEGNVAGIGISNIIKFMNTRK